MFWQILLSLICFFCVATSEFLEPSGADGSTIYYVGETVDITWNGTSTYSILSLGMTTTTNRILSWLVSNDVSNPTHVQWMVTTYGFDLAESHLFKFVIVNGTNFGSPIWSTLFIIQNASSSTSTSTTAATFTASTTTTAATFTASTTTTTTSPPTNTSSVSPSSTASPVKSGQESTSSGLSNDAKAGIGVGVSIGGIICIAALGWWIVRRRHQRVSVNLVPHNSTKMYEPGINEPGLLDSRELRQLSELPTTTS